MLMKTDPRSGTATHTYNKLDRITRTSYSGGGTDFSSTLAVTYTYSSDAPFLERQGVMPSPPGA